jgi:hypothetical protein
MWTGRRKLPLGRDLGRGYTFVETLATIAFLTIILGIMVSLARHVRSASANDLTKDLLRRLEEAMVLYLKKNGDHPPNLAPFIPDQPRVATPTLADESTLALSAEINNLAVVRLLKANHVFPVDRFEDLPISYYDGLMVRDAWGSPIVFMSHMNPAVGMAAKGWFFFSAGPDRKYTTKSDNLYSYELPSLKQPSP